MDTNYSLSDIAAATGNGRNGGMWGGDGAWWIILFLIWGRGGYGFGNGFGGYGGGGFNSPAGQGFATRTDIDAALATRGIESGIQNISTQLCNGFAGVNSAIANLGHQNQQCLNRFAKAIANLFTKHVNAVGTYA